MFFAESPSLVDTTSVFWNVAWSVGMIGSCAAGFVSSARATWEGVERIAAVLILALLVGFAVAPIQRIAQGNPDVIAYSAVALALSIFPGWRALHLVRKLVRRRR